MLFNLSDQCPRPGGRWRRRQPGAALRDARDVSRRAVTVVEHVDGPERRGRVHKVLLGCGPPPRDLRNRHVMSGAGPDALTHALDVELGSVRANEHHPDFVPVRDCCAHDPGPRASRIGTLETEVLSLFEVPPDGGVHDPPGFALVPDIVPIAQVLGDRVRVVEGFRQLVRVPPDQVVLPAPLPPITMVSFGIGGRWPMPFRFAAVGPGSVSRSVRVSRGSITPSGGSVMMILPSSSEAYTHAFPCLKHIARESSTAGMVIATLVGVVVIGIPSVGVPRSATRRSPASARRFRIVIGRSASIENDGHCRIAPTSRPGRSCRHPATIPALLMMLAAGSMPRPTGAAAAVRAARPPRPKRAGLGRRAAGRRPAARRSRPGQLRQRERGQRAPGPPGRPGGRLSPPGAPPRAPR